ncbi:Emopamil-binding protein [Aspergillus egyptiacus]|nr:Emopamil-binding protein [Aspergillus egyptiacus]
MTLIPHHYYPPTIQLPHYAANTSSVISLIVQFGILWAAVLAVAILLIRRVHPSASRSDQLAFLWMCLTGCIHLFFEAYFVLNHETLAGSATLFGQLWKEYSLSDSRYLTSDAFLVAMEAVTAFAWGPLSFLIAYCIAVQHPCRHALQLIVSLGQIYGDVLYFATSLFGEHFHGVLFCRPEGYYFWFYYFFFNILWIVIPSCFLVQSVREITGAFRKLAEIGGAGAGRNGKKDI